jgi:outer membrane protein
LFNDLAIQGEQNILASQKNKRERWPKLDAYAAIKRYNEQIESAGQDAANDMKNESVIGLRITMNLGSGFESNREAKALFIEAQAARTFAAYEKQQIEIDIKSEMAQLKSLFEQIQETDQNIKRAENYYKFTQSEYNRGVKNSPDVLGASEKLFDTKNKHLETIKNYQVAKAHLISKIGQ